MSPRSRVRRFLSRCPEATLALGEALGAALRAAGARGVVLALCGELGAGKTTLVRGLARGLGAEGEVTSPSFTLMHEHDGPLPLWHLDAWMAGRERALLEGGAAECLLGPGVAAVEWAERIEDLLPSPRLELRLAHRSPEQREIRLALIPGPEGGAAIDRESPQEGLLATCLAALELPEGLEELVP
jgi:tRNA threonylcarbamoyladenosine biosynthesis protein TsaE